MKVYLSYFLFLALVFQPGLSFGQNNKEASKKKASDEKKAPGFDHSHSLWNQILKESVVSKKGGKATAFKYGSVNKEKLDKYVKSLLAVEKSIFETWSKDLKLAFYFNLYNALTVQLVTRHYPIASIKDIGSWYKSTWKKEFFKIFGEKAYLDKIEHEWVRESGKYQEARVHFAFNCASIGCPALAPEAFVGSRLEKQLETATKNFLSDNSRNSFDIKTNTMSASKIFDWYGKDFAKGWNGYKSLKGFFGKHADSISKDPASQKVLRSGNFKVKFLPYDWKLNVAK